jgi:hypothetical protein
MAAVRTDLFTGIPPDNGAIQTAAIIDRFHSEVNLRTTLLMVVARTQQLFFAIDAAKKTMVTVESFGWGGELDDIFANGLWTVGTHDVQHLREISPAQQVVFADPNHVSYVKSHTSSL